jgi:putative MATE family efflux protein
MQRYDANRVVILYGTLLQAISLLVLPSFISQVLQTTAWIGEMFFVRRIGDTAIAAIGAVDEATWLPFTLVASMLTAATTLIAQSWGAGDEEATQVYVETAIQQGLILGALIMTLWFYREFVWRIFNLSETVEELATRYLLIFVLFTIPIVSGFPFVALYQGIGDMVTPLIATGVGVLLQLTLNALLITKLGISGVACAAVSSYCVRLLLLVALLRHLPIKLSLRKLINWNREAHCKLLKLALPVWLQTVQWSLCSFVLFSIVGRTANSTEALAALTLGWRIESLLLIPAFSFATAAQTIVGQNVGAGQIERARSHSYLVALIGAVILAVVGFFFIVTADLWARTFSQNELTVRYTASYLRMNALAEPLVAVGMIIGSSLRGAGDTLSPALITVFSIWFVRIPTAYYLCMIKGYDATAAWLSMAISNVVGGLLTIPAMERFWKLKRSQQGGNKS